MNALAWLMSYKGEMHLLASLLAGLLSLCRHYTRTVTCSIWCKAVEKKNHAYNRFTLLRRQQESVLEE